ncbi:hypothetical protein L1987_16034 [Smallanthus sonchifolius]|uniref:Uncharacterized protein n=1 Tax=Smallanthus sonchifolius TaxID=185202 RepID=A0ACB9J9C2_9ASTR|nr:hypothetical protein L1987_16034 [Smallanthus sonchifolius]
MQGLEPEGFGSSLGLADAIAEKEGSGQTTESHAIHGPPVSDARIISKKGEVGASSTRPCLMLPPSGKDDVVDASKPAPEDESLDLDGGIVKVLLLNLSKCLQGLCLGFIQAFVRILPYVYPNVCEDSALGLSGRLLGFKMVKLSVGDQKTHSITYGLKSNIWSSLAERNEEKELRHMERGKHCTYEGEDMGNKQGY